MHREQLLVAEPQAEELALALNLTLALPPALTSSPSPPAPKPEARSPKPEARSPKPYSQAGGGRGAHPTLRAARRAPLDEGDRGGAARRAAGPHHRRLLEGLPKPGDGVPSGGEGRAARGPAAAGGGTQAAVGGRGPAAGGGGSRRAGAGAPPSSNPNFPLTLIKPSPNPHPSPRNTICPAPRRGALAVLGRRPG